MKAEQLKRRIPEEFWKADDDCEMDAPRASTVRELIEVLKKLPLNLGVGSFGEGLRVTVTNISRPDEVHVRFETESDYCY